MERREENSKSKTRCHCFPSHNHGTFVLARAQPGRVQAVVGPPSNCAPP